MAYGDIQLKLVGGEKVLEKLAKLDELAKQMRDIVHDLNSFGFIHIDKPLASSADADKE